MRLSLIRLICKCKGCRSGYRNQLENEESDSKQAAIGCQVECREAASFFKRFIIIRSLPWDLPESKNFQKQKGKPSGANIRKSLNVSVSVTRRTLAGIPDEPCKLATGHSRRSVHQRYIINPPDEQIFEIFTDWKNCPTVVRNELRSAEQSAR